MENIDSKENLIRLVNQYKNLVFSVCLKLTGDYFVAEDITQETFILAYTHYESFDGNAEKAWICRIASNKCIDYQRQAARRLTYMPEEELLEERMSTSEDPLQMYLNTDSQSLTRLLHEYGYQSAAFHPYESTGWLRKQA